MRLARGFSLFVGLRYSLDRNTNQLVSFLSRLSMFGLVLGVALLITVLSVMNGFDREMRGRILSLVPQLTVTPWSAAEDWQQLATELEGYQGVAGTAPFVQLNGMLIKNQKVQPALFYGLDPQREARVSNIADYADLSLLVTDNNGAVPVILGAGLARALGVDEGDRVVVAIPSSSSKVGFRRATVVGTVSTGTELDQNLLLLDLQQAKKMQAGSASVGVRVRLDDVFSAPALAWELRNSLDRFYLIRDWTQQFGNMYQAIQMSRRLVSIMLLAVVAVAVFNVVSTLVMVVNDKQSDIGILRSQGASQGQILRVFLIYGAVIGLLGALLGAALGIGLALSVTDAVAALERLLNIQFLKSDVYPISYLPSDLRWQDVLLVSGVSFVMSLLATVYPAVRASRMPPAEALRYR